MSETQDAKTLNEFIPDPYQQGKYYPAKLNEKEVEVARKHGRGRQSGNVYLHVLIPMTERLLESGNVVDTYPVKDHWRIQLHNPEAKFKHVATI